MAINEWWTGDPAERYWLEITDRESLGEDLYAPKADQSGNETWSYSLVSHVRDGDIVFHYWKQAGQEKAIVGFSKVTGSLESTTIPWQPHGTYGRTTQPAEARPAWRFPLAGFTDLTAPSPSRHSAAWNRSCEQSLTNWEGDSVSRSIFPLPFRKNDHSAQHRVT